MFTKMYKPCEIFGCNHKYYQFLLAFRLVLYFQNLVAPCCNGSISWLHITFLMEPFPSL